MYAYVRGSLKMSKRTYIRAYMYVYPIYVMGFSLQAGSGKNFPSGPEFARRRNALCRESAEYDRSLGTSRSEENCPRLANSRVRALATCGVEAGYI